MNCFPVDEEILASIPFSNNSVVLAATSVLQQLLTLADERDLHSVDVLLTSIWLLLRERKLDGEEQDLTHADVAPVTNTTHKGMFERTNQKRSGRISESLENKNIYNFNNVNKVQDTLSHSNGATSLELNDNESASSGLKEGESSVDQESLNLCVTSELLSNKVVVCQTENASTQTDTVHITNNQNENANEDVKSLGSSTNHKCISQDAILPNKHIADSALRSGEMLKHNEDKVTRHPQEIPKETESDSLNSNVSSKHSLSPKSADVSLVNKDRGNIYASDIENRDLSKLKVEGDQKSNNDLNFLNESDSILKTSDGKTFQISSDDGFEDSFVIEKVDSDDSDNEVDNSSEKQKVKGNITDGDNTQVEILTQENVKVLQPYSEIYTEENFDVTRKRQRDEESALISGTSAAVSMNTSPYIVSCTDMTDKSWNKQDKSIDSYMETCGTIDKQEPVQKSLLSGIISSDNDSELKIVNIAGGVTFYDDCEDTFDSNNKMTYYVDTKPGTSIYNPLSYSNYTPAPSSGSSLYSNVVFSSYAGIPGTFMSADPRLAVQNCQPMFFPNSMNTAGLESDPNGRLYPVANASQYGNCQQNIPQSFQYFVPSACNLDFVQPMPVEIKSEKKIIIPSKRSKSKKRKRRKSPEGTDGVCVKNFYYLKDPVTGKLKEYYNVRDPSGKFIKVNRTKPPYINNMQQSPLWSSKGIHKTSIKEEIVTETSSDDIGQPAKPLMMANKQTSTGTTVSPGKLLTNQISSSHTDAQPSETSAEQTLRQLRGQKLQLDKKLKAILAKKKEKPKKNMTEKEKKNHKAFETKRLNMLKKLHAEKKELAKREVAERARLKSLKSPDIEYVVRDKGTHINSAGLSEEYTVVTIKGLLSKPAGDQTDSLTDQGSTVREEKKSSQTPPQLANPKKKPSLKQSKGKKSLKKSVLAKETVRPIKLVSNSIPALGTKAVIKSAKQKAAAKKVLKIKQSKANTSKIIKKNKQKVTDNLVSDTLLKTIEPQLSDTVSKSAGKTVAKRTKEISKKGKQNIHKVKTLISKKGANKTKRILKQVTKAKPEVEVQDLISVHHGERGAKLAAQQRISAYNDSEESNEIVK